MVSQKLLFIQRERSRATRRNANLTNHFGFLRQVLVFKIISGSEKPTIANALSKEFYKQSKPHDILDGDNLRFGLHRDLGFTEADRTENIRRTAETAKLMADAGLIVLLTLISPKEAGRQMAKETIGEELFSLVYVDTPLEVCEQRDPKGLYKKARAGEIPNFTGIGAEFEVPRSANATILAFKQLDLEKLFDKGNNGKNPS